MKDDMPVVMSLYIIAVAGGSGSGKTTFARRVLEKLDLDQRSQVSIIGQDSYYKDQSEKFDHDGGAVNFDHPQSIDFDLLCDHLKALKSGKSVEIPQYDFATHRRLDQTVELGPKKVILVDGILIYCEPKLVELFDHKIYIDAPENIRFERRLKRDVAERGRTPDGVRKQFFDQVKPMHDEFVEPKKDLCDLIVDPNSFDDQVQKVSTSISDRL